MYSHSLMKQEKRTFTDEIKHFVKEHKFRYKMCWLWCFHISRTIKLEETVVMTIFAWIFVFTGGLIYFTPIWKWLDDHMVHLIDTPFFDTLWDTIQFEYSGKAKMLTKSGFQKIVSHEGLPYPESYTLDTLPTDRKVWCKTDDSACGRGHFVYDPTKDAKPTDPELTMQEILVPHPNIEQLLSHPHMPTFRFTSVSICGKKPRCIEPFILRIAPPGSLLDNDHTKSGRVMLFANREGRFVKAVSYPENEPIDQMPNGVDFREVEIPFWKEMVQLIERAHAELLPHVCLLGWDIACTPNGPKLVEVNNCNPVPSLFNKKVEAEINAAREDQIAYLLKSIKKQVRC